MRNNRNLNPFSFSGRIGRIALIRSLVLGAFVWFAVRYIRVLLVRPYQFWPHSAIGDGWLAWAEWALVIAAAVVIVLNWISALVRRLHDLGYPAQFILTVVTSFQNLEYILMLFVKRGEPRENEFGAAPGSSTFEPIRIRRRRER